MESAARVETQFLVVGIGASAGGLAAFEAFFSALPDSPGLAFVVVQHLAPNHKSILAQLIGKFTSLPVLEAVEGTMLQANSVFIIPPNQDLTLRDGALHLAPPTSPRGHRLPIDHFFRSMAEDLKDRSVCIILSGTGTDGTLGLRAVKGEGGLAMAQDPATAEYSGMPESALATGLVDYILPPEQMANALLGYSRTRFPRAANLPGAVVQPPLSDTWSEQTLPKILAIVRVQTGHDFSGYKPNTIIRRVERRMALNQMQAPADYLSFLQQNPGEANGLFRDFLIGVTCFFREPEMFEAFESVVIPELFHRKPDGSVIRVWTPGCSTGEEAYSIAMLLRESMEVARQNRQVQVFATDLDREAIRTARAGIYPAGIASDVSSERLSRHFVAAPADGVFRVTKVIRDMLIFSEQDLTRDPPFSHLDLISCRNLMIYLGPDLQKRLIRLFHYGLNPGGFLALGSAETIGEFSDLFTAVDSKAKLYRRNSEPFRLSLTALKRYRPTMIDEESAKTEVGGKVFKEGKFSLKDVMERALLQRYAPAAALVSGNGDICYLHGRTGLYLEPSQGEASLNILKMAREGLLPKLTFALVSAVSQVAPVRHETLRVKTNGSFSTIDLEVRPVASVGGSKGLFLVLFEERTTVKESAPQESAPEQSTPPEAAVTPPPDAIRMQVFALQQQLRAKDEYLQSTILATEASSEALRSSHEELQSINEELQSTNEELETSKEELQSINEELTTVNAELQQRLSDLSRVNNDMNNLLAGTGIGTIFVDHELRIQRFTPAVTQVINLIPSDIGRPVGHIVSKLVDYSGMVEDVQSVLNSLTPKEVEVQTLGGAWYLMRIRPYRTLENVIEGAVVLFFDISEMKRIQDQQRLSEARVQQFATSMPLVILTFGVDGACDYAGPRWLGYTGATAEEPLGVGWTKSIHAEDRGRVIALWNHCVSSGKGLEAEFRLRGQDGSFRWFRGAFAAEGQSTAERHRWLCAFTDVETEKQVTASLAIAAEQRQTMLDWNPNGILAVDRSGQVRQANAAMAGVLGRSVDEIRGRNGGQLFSSAIQPSGEAFDWKSCLDLTSGVDTQLAIGIPSESEADGRHWWRIRAISMPWPEDRAEPATVWMLWEASVNPANGYTVAD